MQLGGRRRVIGAKRVLGVGWSSKSGGVKCDPNYTYGGQAKYETENEDGVLTKSSEEDASASDKAVRGIESERDLPTVMIIRQNTRVDIKTLA